jgi:hypothetical protein
MFKGKAAGNTAVFSISPELFRISCPHRTADIPQIQFYVKNVKTRKPLNIKGLAGSVFRIFPKYYSHSMVPVGFGVRSKRTRLTPFTSSVIRWVIC